MTVLRSRPVMHAVLLSISAVVLLQAASASYLTGWCICGVVFGQNYIIWQASWKRPLNFLHLMVTPNVVTPINRVGLPVGRMQT